MLPKCMSAQAMGERIEKWDADLSILERVVIHDAEQSWHALQVFNAAQQLRVKLMSWSIYLMEAEQPGRQLDREGKIDDSMPPGTPKPVLKSRTDVYEEPRLVRE